MVEKVKSVFKCLNRKLWAEPKVSLKNSHYKIGPALPKIWAALNIKNSHPTSQKQALFFAQNLNMHLQGEQDHTVHIASLYSSSISQC